MRLHHHRGIGSVRPISLFPIRKRFKPPGTSATPDIPFGQIAQQSSDANQKAAFTSAALSNINTSSPLGTSFFTPYGVSGDGLGPAGYDLKQSLSPQTQDVYSGQTSLASLLAQLGGGVANAAGSQAQTGADIVRNAYSQLGGALPSGGLDFSGLPSLNTDFGPQVKSAQDAAYNSQAGYLDPQFAEKHSDLRQQLADEGIPLGSDAYSRATGDLGRQENLAYQQAQNAAVAAGNQEQAQLFGENLSGRQEGVNELLQKYQLPASVLSSLVGTGEGVLSGAAGQLPSLNNLANFTWASGVPTFGGGQTNVTAPNVPGAASVANQSSLNRFNSGNTLNNQVGGALGSLGSALGLGSGGTGNLLFGSGGLSGALGLGNSGLLGSIFGSGGASAASGDALASLFSSAGGLPSLLAL